LLQDVLSQKQEENSAPDVLKYQTEHSVQMKSFVSHTKELLEIKEKKKVEGVFDSYQMDLIHEMESTLLGRWQNI
jgi:hypothetical protein